MHDLSIVTDTLCKIINDALQISPIWGGHQAPFSIKVTGQHPDTPKGTSDCELNLYLFHIAQDKFLANSFWSQAGQSGGGAGSQPVASEPLSLDLWYMLSAQSQSSYVQEQQALSVAMQALHEHGTFTILTPTPLPAGLMPSEATLVLESPTFDELSRLWQALTLPLRTTAQYRVSVVFLTPDHIPAPMPDVASVNLTASPSGTKAASTDDPSLPRLFGTRRAVEYREPGTPPVPASFLLSPASTAPAPAAVTGQEVTLDGRQLADTDRILLVSYAGGVPAETDVTATWKRPLATPYGTPPVDGVPIVLRPPEGDPTPPGRYELTVGRPAVPGFRARPVPIEVAAWIDPAGGPLLAPAGGLYTLPVRNVPASGAQLRLGSVPLVRIADGGTPTAGQWQHSADEITFAAPGGLAAGAHRIGLRAGDVESDPALWAVV